MNFAFLVNGVSAIYPPLALTEPVGWQSRFAASWHQFWSHHLLVKA